MTEEHLSTAGRLFAAFAAHDAEGMAACYAPHPRFEDPVFGRLEGPDVTGMWRMLLGRARDLVVTPSPPRYEGDVVRVDWVATYTFSATGRKVVNRVQSALRFEGGLVVDQVDRFDLRRWCLMALGLKGWLVFLLPPLRARLRAQARRGLRRKA
jgi:ketosteroid isomerase-like protein